MNDKCNGIFGFIFGHHYMHIFDNKKEYQSLNDDSSGVKHAQIVINGIQPISKSEKTYVKSLCSRCGREINKNNILQGDKEYKYNDFDDWYDFNEDWIHQSEVVEKHVKRAFVDSRRRNND